VRPFIGVLLRGAGGGDGQLQPCEAKKCVGQVRRVRFGEDERRTVRPAVAAGGPRRPRERMKRTSTAGLVVGLLLAAPPALAQYTSSDEYESGFGEISLNAGFALPLGSAINGVNESDAINFAVPFGLAVGYRIGGTVFVGGTFSYGPFGSPNGTKVGACTTTGYSCSSYTFHTGFTVQWHPLGSRGLDPYIGLGAGYEWLYVDVSAGGLTSTLQYNGFTWVDVPLGIDFRLNKDIRFGPFFDFSMGEYRNGILSMPAVSGLISQRAIHFWLTAGLRIVFLSI